MLVKGWWVKDPGVAVAKKCGEDGLELETDADPGPMGTFPTRIGYRWDKIR